ncbi:MAG: ATP-binding cassette domain-containing protein [Lachnospiraceae bacterium]|nr:ATP-binding cassette domain-containing protein [Lachnospiraceae bacterium]
MEEINVRNLTFSYSERAAYALDDVSFSVGKGEMLLVIGESGSGKTTLLRHLKPAYKPVGNITKESRIYVEGSLLDELSDEQQAFMIGYVGQQAEACQVTDKVWHELSFGLESMGASQDVMSRRVSEIAAFFGLEKVFHEKLSHLSGGQRQLVNLAAVMVTEPEILILDEPTSQLDPMAAAEFFRMVRRIHDELGTTIIMTEHRLEEAYVMADKVLVLDKGKMIMHGTTDEVGRYLYEGRLSLFRSLPVATRLFYDLTEGRKSDEKVPESVNEGRQFLSRYMAKNNLEVPDMSTCDYGGKEDKSRDSLPGKREFEKKYKPILEGKELWFRYDKNANDVLKNCDIKLPEGKITALMGGNGAGKSTLLHVLAGNIAAYIGKVKKGDISIGMLPQNPQAMFLYDKVSKEIGDYPDIVKHFELEECLDMHPFDLSGGQMEKLALAKLVSQGQDVLLLDEPGKGMDYAFKEKLGIYLKELTAKGKTILMVSHDLEMCASYADCCGMFFDGHIVSLVSTREFFKDNSLYTTAVRRMCKGIIEDAVLYEDVVKVFKGKLCGVMNPSQDDSQSDSESSVDNKDTLEESSDDSKNLDENIQYIENESDEYSSVDKIPDENAKDSVKCEDDILVGEKTESTSNLCMTIIPLLTFLVLMPLTIYFGERVLHQRKYYFISLLLIVEGVGAFLAGFEHGKPRLKEIITVAAMAAITALSRAAFYMVPAVKPMAAFTIISGVALGGTDGFIVGALSMLVSDIFFGQGPWTPWQMFAMGLLGLVAGLIFNRIADKDKDIRIKISVYGLLAVLVIYGGIMNPASVLMYQENVSWKMLLASYAPGIPIDIIHAVSTFIFLMIGAKPMLEKLQRVKRK